MTHRHTFESQPSTEVVIAPGTFSTLFRRPDFRRNPVKALAKRFWWRARWNLRQDLWQVQLADGSPVFLNHGGPAALIYLQGSSEPDTSLFLNAFLRPGMAFIDVGAHLGEYTLLASRLVGTAGQVHSFEAAPAMFELLQRNVTLNRLANVSLHRAAIFRSDGEVPFRVREDCAISSIEDSGTLLNSQVISVPALRLDTYWKDQKNAIDLIKVDVEGAELGVLEGSDRLGRRPTWIFECSARNYRKFSLGVADVLNGFRNRGYSLWRWENGTCEAVSQHFEPEEDVNLIASNSTFPPVA